MPLEDKISLIAGRHLPADQTRSRPLKNVASLRWYAAGRAICQNLWEKMPKRLVRTAERGADVQSLLAALFSHMQGFAKQYHAGGDGRRWGIAATTCQWQQH
jgi:hypothetical protein